MKRSDAETAMVAAASMAKPMKRSDVTDLIAFRKIKLGIKWAEVSKKVGESKEWVTAACLGQMQMTKKQAETVGEIFDLPEEAVLVLQTVPYKGSLPTAIPTDPLIYRRPLTAARRCLPAPACLARGRRCRQAPAACLAHFMRHISQREAEDGPL